MLDFSIDKELVKKNFEKNIKTYDKHAKIQNEMARVLFSMLKEKKYSSILEIGSYTGNLTRLIAENIEYDRYLALDIIDSFSYIKDLGNIDFMAGDIENTELSQKFDLIISNASLQWCSDFSGTIKKLRSCLNKGGTLAYSVMGHKNFREIREVFHLGLDYKTTYQLSSFEGKCEILEKTYTIQFQNPYELLRHIKLTGVNSIPHKKFTLSELREKMDILDKKFNNKLTYNPIFVIQS